jgi:predicted pyridoxine 5'-phosphate oxidase superfamily flavin-nucleotide-binding protein
MVAPRIAFHAGEIAIQKRLGVETKMEAQGRRVIRDYYLSNINSSTLNFHF